MTQMSTRSMASSSHDQWGYQWTGVRQRLPHGVLQQVLPAGQTFLLPSLLLHSFLRLHGSTNSSFGHWTARRQACNTAKHGHEVMVILQLFLDRHYTERPVHKVTVAVLSSSSLLYRGVWCVADCCWPYSTEMMVMVMVIMIVMRRMRMKRGRRKRRWIAGLLLQILFRVPKNTTLCLLGDIYNVR